MSACAKKKQALMSACAKKKQAAMSACAKKKQAAMSACAKKKQAAMSEMRKTLSVLAVAVVLVAGCGHSDTMTAEPSMTLAAPTPPEMQEMAPQPNAPPAPRAHRDRTRS